MTRCVVPKCSEVGVHHFPIDKKIRRLWLRAIRREKLIPTKIRGMEYQHRYLKKEAVPSIFPWNTQLVSEKVKERDDRLMARNLKKKQLFGKPSTSHRCKPKKPQIFFYQVETCFRINKISAESSKFDYLTSQLEPEYLENIWDIIQSTDSNKYSLAKERLLNLFTESEEKQIQTLLTGLELGDNKPSQLLRQMRQLAGKNITDKILRSLWLDKLPKFIKNTLIISEETLDKLSIMADKMKDFYANEVFSNEVQPSTSESTVDKINLLQKISLLEKQIEALRMDYNNRYRSEYRTNRARSVSRSQSRRRKFNPDRKYCYYHFRFGTKCLPEKCKKPCSFDSGNASKQ
ncbi:hypothetical protein ACJJTC_015208 [Scirpophaga incertulas]